MNNNNKCYYLLDIEYILSVIAILNCLVVYCFINLNLSVLMLLKIR